MNSSCLDLRMAIGATALLLLLGCTAVGVEAIPSATLATPQPTSTLLDKQALLHEGTAVVTGYNAALSQLTADYSVDASVLSPWATPEEVTRLRAFQDTLRSEGKRLVGDSEITNVVLQDFDVEGERYTILTCEVIDNLRVLNSKGVDVTPASRESSSTLQNVLVGHRSELRVETSVVWSGSSIC